MAEPHWLVPSVKREILILYVTLYSNRGKGESCFWKKYKITWYVWYSWWEGGGEREEREEKESGGERERERGRDREIRERKGEGGKERGEKYLGKWRKRNII